MNHLLDFWAKHEVLNGLEPCLSERIWPTGWRRGLAWQKQRRQKWLGALVSNETLPSATT